MKTINIIEGLQVLLPFYDKEDGYHNSAEHDVFCAIATDNPLTSEALNKMIALGWLQEHCERDYENDFCCSDYRADESWICYT